MLLHEVGLAVLVPEVPLCAVPALAQSKALAMVTATTLIENDSGERAEQTDEEGTGGKIRYSSEIYIAAQSLVVIGSIVCCSYDIM